MITTTLNAIRTHGPCQSGWHKLLDHLGKTTADDEPLLVAVILDSNGLNDALWALRACGDDGRQVAQRFAIWAARQVQHLMTNPQIAAALNTAEAYLDGCATIDELRAANAAANAGARAATFAAYVAACAAYAAACDATDAAAYAATAACAAADVAADVADAAARAARAAYVAADAAARAARAVAAREEMQQRQTDKLKEMLT